MATEYDLRNMRDRLRQYERELDRARQSGDSNLIAHWENNIRGLETEISNLEYALRN